MLISNIQQDDVDEAALLVGTVFSQSEPQTVHWNLKEADMVEWAYRMLQKSLIDDMSVCVKSKNGHIIGCIIASRMSTDVSDNEFIEAKPLFDMTKHLYKSVNIEREEDVLCIHVAAVHPDFTRKGVCSALLTHVVDNAKKKGYTLALSELTSIGTQKILLQKLGFFISNEIIYDEYGKGFNGCSGSCILALKRLNDTK
jgi:predicted N-acetyltransferase YhbS